MSYEVIQIDQEDRVAVITLNRPEVLNALSFQLVTELDEAITEMESDDGVGAIVLTGMGERAFSAGADIHENREFSDEERERVTAKRADYTWHLATSIKPVIGAINGWDAGAGFYVMLTSTDIRIACDEHARFKFALLSQGWVGGGPGATFLTRQVAHADAMRILLTDEAFDAKEALRINLINEVVPHDQLMSRAEEIATQIAGMPPLAVRMMKEFVSRFRDIPVTEAWRVQTLINSLSVSYTHLTLPTKA